MTIEEQRFNAIPQSLRDDCLYYFRTYTCLWFRSRNTGEQEIDQEKLLQKHGLISIVLINHSYHYALSAWGRKVAYMEVLRIASLGQIKRRA